jgi:hypothetical protein
MLPVLNNAYRLREVSFQGVNYKSLLKVKTKNMVYKGASM